MSTKSFAMSPLAFRPNSIDINMNLNQIIEKLNFETTYVADIEVDDSKIECLIKSAIFESPEKISKVCDWTTRLRLTRTKARERACPRPRKQAGATSSNWNDGARKG